MVLVKSRRVAYGRVVVLVAAAVTVAVTGCTGDKSHADNTSVDIAGFDEVISTAIEGATSGGASEAQVELLRGASESGELTLEQARAAVRATAECLTGLGFTAEYTEQTAPTGLVLPGYRVQTDEGPGGDGDGDPAFQASQQCEVSESFWVSMVYQTQPSSVQLNVEYINTVLEPGLRQCLTDSGFEVADDATGVDMVRQARTLKIEDGETLECFDLSAIPNF